jgi:hypothetical protein
MNLLLAAMVFTFMAAFMAIHGPTSDRPDATQEDSHRD